MKLESSVSIYAFLLFLGKISPPNSMYQNELASANLKAGASPRKALRLPPFFPKSLSLRTVDRHCSVIAASLAGGCHLIIKETVSIRFLVRMRARPRHTSGRALCSPSSLLLALEYCFSAMSRSEVSPTQAHNPSFHSLQRDLNNAIWKF